MWPQKWNASARSARRAAATKPPPVTASSSRPTRARKPRRVLASATASLNTRGRSRRGREQALELEKRVERSLRPHFAVRREHDRVRAARDRERGPDVRVGFLVEELELDFRIGGDEPERRLESGAECTVRRCEDGQCKRCPALEAFDQLEAAPELWALVVERERRLWRNGKTELAELPGEREHRDPEPADREERHDEAGREPGLTRRPGLGNERQRDERGAKQRRADDRRPADPRAAAEAAAGRTGAAARDRGDEREHEDPAEDNGSFGGTGDSREERGRKR